jgi:recombinational DNA repair ATPase RecF
MRHRSSMISRIELYNFMSHAHTVIEPAAGLTVLVGPNNCGKSAIVSALQILCENDKGDYMVRHGEDECRIVLVTDDGHRRGERRDRIAGRHRPQQMRNRALPDSHTPDGISADLSFEDCFSSRYAAEPERNTLI